MKTIFRYLLFFLTFIFVLISLTLFIMPRFLNTDAVKFHIEQLLTTQLKRIVHIQDVSVSFFPDISLHVTDFTLKNAPGFDHINQAAVQSIDLYIEIWPLLDKQLVFKKILFQDVLLNLHKKKNGHNNWDDLISMLSSQKTSKQHNTSFDTKKSFSLLTLGSLMIKNAEIQFNDQQNNRQFSISRLKYQCTGMIRQIIDMGFDISGTIPYSKGLCHFDSRISLNGRASFLFNKKRYSIDDANLNIDSTTLLSNDQFIDSHLDAKLAFSPEHGALELSDMIMELNNIQFDGNLYVRDLFDQPSLSGHLIVNSENLLDTLALFIKPVGFNGPISCETTFQTRGKTIQSILHHLDVTTQMNLKQGQFVWPENYAKTFDPYMHSIASADIDLHVKQVQAANSKHLTFQTNCKGMLTRLNDALDLNFNTNGQIITGPSLNDTSIDLKSFDIQTDWDNLSGTYGIKGNLFYDGKTKNTLLKNMVLTGPDVTARFNLEKKHPDIKSHVDIQINHVRNVLSAFSIKTPDFTNNKVFNRIQFASQIVLNKKQFQLNQMSFILDDHATFKGKILYHNDPQTIKLDLKVDHFNADHYWIKHRLNKRKTSQINPKSQQTKAEKSFFQSSMINAKLDFNHLIYYNLLFDNAQINLQGNKGMYRLSPFSGLMYGGNFNGHWTFDYRHKRPKTSLLLQCKDIQIEKFLIDYVHFDRIDGKLSMKASLSCDINGRRLIYPTLNGNTKLELTDGAINGILIVPTEVQKQILQMHKKKHSSLGISKKQLVERMTGQVKFRNGVMSNSDMEAISERLKVSGEGILDLVSKQVDYTFHVRIKPFPTIPYKVKGPVSSPQASLDKSEFLTSAVSSFFNQAGNLGPEAIKDTLDIGSKTLDVNIDPLQKTVEKGSQAIKSTINKGSGTIKETLGVGTDALEASKEAIQSIGNRLKGFFQKHKNDNDDE